MIPQKTTLGKIVQMAGSCTLTMDPCSATARKKTIMQHAGGFEQGDRVGVLLDLGDGSLRFFRNGVQHGQGYVAGSVTGPVVAAVQMDCHDDSVRLLPNAQQPE